MIFTYFHRFWKHFWSQHMLQNHQKNKAKINTVVLLEFFDFLNDFGSHLGVDFYEFSSRRQKWPTCVSTAPA